MATYTSTLTWVRGDEAFADGKYSRAHEIAFDGGVTMPASSSPHVVKVPLSREDAVDPEEMLVASLSSCHMLFFLDFARRGGFVVDEDEAGRNSRGAEDEVELPFAFTSGADLLSMGAASGRSFAEMMLENELVHRSLDEVNAGLDAIAGAMDASIEAGCCSTGILPGGLKVKRRAPQIADDIRNRHEQNLTDPLAMMDWINLWAMAVNEENAAGGKVVTAPTNGAAGIIPAVIRFYRRGYRGDDAGVRTFLLAAGAVGVAARPLKPPERKPRE